MSRQLGCRDMCKFETSPDHYYQNYSYKKYHEIGIMNTSTLCDMGIDKASENKWDLLE